VNCVSRELYLEDDVTHPWSTSRASSSEGDISNVQQEGCIDFDGSGPTSRGRHHPPYILGKRSMRIFFLSFSLLLVLSLYI
jgi:hypothetical protein